MEGETHERQTGASSGRWWDEALKLEKEGCGRGGEQSVQDP